MIQKRITIINILMILSYVFSVRTTSAAVVTASILTTLPACSLSNADLSTPEKSFAAIQKAVREHDIAVLEDAIYLPDHEAKRLGSFDKHDKLSMLANNEKEAGIRMFFTEPSFLYVESPTELPRMRWHGETPTEAARVHCSMHWKRPPASTIPTSEERITFMFVRRSGRWQMMMTAELPWDRRAISTSTAQRAMSTLNSAIVNKDFDAIWSIIDPSMLDGVDKVEFMQTARERFAIYDQWQKKEIEAERKRERFVQPPQKMPYPFNPKAASGDEETESMSENGHEVVRFWKISAPHQDPKKSRQRKGCETFVKIGDRWYWRPDASATVWPVRRPVSNPLTQPAKRETIRIELPPSASQPASKPTCG